MEKKILTISIVALIIGIIAIIIFSGKERDDVIEPITPSSIEPTESPENTLEPTEEPSIEVSTSEAPVTEFTEKQKNKVEEAFTSFMDFADYQTTLNEGDSILYITFKDLGTVTFKLYDEYTSDSIDWLQSLIDKNTEIQYDDKRTGGRLGIGSPQFQFITTDRHYNREEQVSNLFPMKYCLYHIPHSSNNFYFCTANYVANRTDEKNVPEEYLDYLKTYNGNMSLYQNSIILGMAVENAQILDILPSNFQIESMKMIRDGREYSTSFEIDYNEPIQVPETTEEPEVSTEPTVESTIEPTQEPESPPESTIPENIPEPTESPTPEPEPTQEPQTDPETGAEVIETPI